MKDKNVQEKGPLGPPSPPPNVIPRILQHLQSK